MNKLLWALPSIALAKSLPSNPEFDAFLEQFGKRYPTEEEYAMRERLFMEKDAFIKKVNSEKRSIRLAHNELSDLTEQEYSKMLGYKTVDEILAEAKSDHPLRKLETAPIKLEVQKGKPIDWVAKGDVSAAVFNQGLCNGGWAFAVADALTSAATITLNKDVQDVNNVASAQQLISCLGAEYGVPDGCVAGNMAAAMLYSMKEPLMKYLDYPYENGASTTANACINLVKKDQKYTATGVQYVDPNNDEAVIAAL